MVEPALLEWYSAQTTSQHQNFQPSNPFLLRPRNLLRHNLSVSSWLGNLGTAPSRRSTKLSDACALRPPGGPLARMLVLELLAFDACTSGSVQQMCAYDYTKPVHGGAVMKLIASAQSLSRLSGMAFRHLRTRQARWNAELSLPFKEQSVLSLSYGPP